MNPCPWGYLTDPKHACQCTGQQIRRYRSKISGPLMDRIDIHVQVPAVPYKDLAGKVSAEPSRIIRRQVAEARSRQLHRFARSMIFANAQMQNRHMRAHCRIDAASEKLLESAIEKLGLSARAYGRILKIGRTIADLAGSDQIQTHHISEAIQYRTIDRGKGLA